MNKVKDRERKIYKVTLQGSFVNFFLMFFKLIAGFWGNSTALIADGIHSLTDFVTDFIVLVFVKIANKPRDENHDYGHGKFETLASIIIGLLLLIVGFGILWSGLSSIYGVLFENKVLESPGVIALVAALVSLLAKELLFRYTYAVGVKVNSEAMKSNAWHHRSDAYSSIGAALGVGGALFLGDKWNVLDSIAAIIVSILIIKEALSMLKGYIDELLERSLPKSVEEEIIALVLSEGCVRKVSDLKTRRIGNYYALDFHVIMDGNRLLKEATTCVRSIEDKLRDRYGDRTEIGIYLNTEENDEQENLDNRG